MVREDPTRRGLLYAGTERGVYVSHNDGDTWKSLSLNLPVTQISDLIVESSSLAIATHGRGFYILDDLSVVRQAPEAAASTAAAVLFKPADAVRGGGPATVTYLLKSAAASLSVEILDGAGRVVQMIPGRVAGPDEAGEAAAARHRPRRLGPRRSSGPGAPTPPPAGRRQGRAAQISRLRQRLTRASNSVAVGAAAVRPSHQ